MKRNLQRYRARTEWYGVELFDREEGRVIPLEGELTDIFLKLLGNNEMIKKETLLYLPLKLGSLELFKNGEWDVEPLVDTPYPKTPDFASAPRRIYWEFTRRCNLNCKACFNRFFSEMGELSFDTIIEIAKRLYEVGVYEIRCTGGEPTTRPDFFEIVDELAKMGFYISMGTNGIYSKDVLKRVMGAPIDWIIISIDGSDESTNAEIRGNGTFEHALYTLKHLASKGCRLRINTLIRKSHYTYEHLKGLAELCDKLHVESLNCIPLRPIINDPSVLDLQLTPVEFREFIQGLNSLRQECKTDFVTTLDLRHTTLHDRIYFKDRSCAAGREGAVISPYGEIYGCSYSLASIPDAPEYDRKKYIAGNVQEEDILQIWNQSGRWDIFRNLNKYKNEKCKKCDYYVTRRCIGNCPIMDENDPAAFDPYCYLQLEATKNF